VDELAENEVVKLEILHPCFPMHTSDLFQPLNHVYDSDNANIFHPFFAMHSSEFFHKLDDESAGSFQPSISSDLCEFTYDFSAGNCLGYICTSHA
jgi:hypothetical protein